jgi:hypothetical protein
MDTVSDINVQSKRWMHSVIKKWDRTWDRLQREWKIEWQQEILLNRIMQKGIWHCQTWNWCDL